MNQSPTVFLLPDSSVLVTLANSDKLDILFEPGWTLVLIDSVVHDVVRTTTPCAETLGKWLRKNNLPVVQTRVHERAQKAIRMGLSIPQQMRMQDLGIQEVMNELALDCGGRLGVFLLEEHRFMAASFLEPQNCKKFTLRAFLTFLEQKALSDLASRTLETDETTKNLIVDQSEFVAEVDAIETPEKAESTLAQSKPEDVALPKTEQPATAQPEEPQATPEVKTEPQANQSVQPQKPVSEEPLEESSLAWLDEKQPVIQRKPVAPAPKAKVGLITGAAIQLLGRKRAEAVEAAFSKLKGTFRLTDSSSKGPQTKKTAPASITPIARQKPVEPPQGSEEQPVAPPKPAAKLKPNEAAQTQEETPRSVTLQKLLEEQAARAKQQPADTKPAQPKAPINEAKASKAESQLSSILPTAPEFPGQTKAVTGKSSPEQTKAVDVPKKPVARSEKQQDLAKKQDASKVESLGVQQTLLSDDDLLSSASENKALDVVSTVEATEQTEQKKQKPAPRSKKVATARSGKAKEKEQAKAAKQPPSFLLKKGHSEPEGETPEAKTPEAKTPEAKTPEAKTPEAADANQDLQSSSEALQVLPKAEDEKKDPENIKSAVDPQLVKDFKNLIA